MRRVVINNPPVNALSADDLEGITAAFDVDPQQVDGVVLSGAASSFGAGLDIKTLANAGLDEVRRIFSGLDAAMRAIAQCRVPTAAVVESHCIGGSAGLAVMTDERLARGEIKFGFPEVRTGLRLSTRLEAALARLCGPDLARQVCVDGKVLNAAELVRSGITVECGEDQDLVFEAIKILSKSEFAKVPNRPWANEFAQIDDNAIEQRITAIQMARESGAMAGLLARN